MKPLMESTTGRIDEAPENKRTVSVRYSTPMGEFTQRLTYANGKLGEEIPVLYHPGNPEQAAIPKAQGMWLWTLAAGALGLVLALIDLVGRVEVEI